MTIRDRPAATLALLILLASGPEARARDVPGFGSVDFSTACAPAAMHAQHSFSPRLDPIAMPRHRARPIRIGPEMVTPSAGWCGWDDGAAAPSAQGSLRGLPAGAPASRAFSAASYIRPTSRRNAAREAARV